MRLPAPPSTFSSRADCSRQGTAVWRSRTRRCCHTGPGWPAGWRRTSKAAPSADILRRRPATGHAEDLNPAETEFLETSRTAADRELREARERADREAKARLREARARRR